MVVIREKTSGRFGSEMGAVCIDFLNLGWWNSLPIFLPILVPISSNIAWYGMGGFLLRYTRVNKTCILME